MQQMVKGLQRKRQGQRLDRGFDGTTGQQANEQPPQPWSRQRMVRQYLGQEDGKAPPTAAPPAPVAAPHPLAPLPLGFPVSGARVVAVELAMAVQSLGSPASRTAELLERKRCSVSSLRLRTKRQSTFDIRFCCPNPRAGSSFF